MDSERVGVVRRTTLVIVGVVCLVLLGEAMTVQSSAPLLILLALNVWMAAPGVALVRRVVPRDTPSVAAWLAGPALGLGLSIFGSFAWWATGVHGWMSLVAGPLLPWTLVWVLGRVAFTINLPRFDLRDVRVAALLLLIVPLITSAPYDHVREPVENGEAYRAYFTADFVWAMAVASEIAKGDIPPANPFLRDHPLHYYWLSHFLSGASYRSLAPLGVTIEAVLLTNGIMFGLAFVLFLYALARSVGATPVFAALAVACGFLANSYEGADMIRAALAERMPWSELTDTNVDAVTRWFYKGMAVDGLQRLLLYQPHHLTGYVFALAAVWLPALAVDITSIALALATGSLLALALLFSTFAGVMLSVAVAIVYVLRLVQHRAVKLLPQCAILVGGPLVLGVLLTQRLGYTNPADGLLMTVGLNPVAVHDWPWIFFLSFGPLLLAGVPSLLRPTWTRGVGAAPAAIAAAAIAFYFFVDVPDMGGVWVGWRSGHMLLIAFVVAAASGVGALWAIAENRAAVAIVLATAVTLAIPTAALDVYNAQDVGNTHDGAGFPWTLVITRAEREAFDWIRENTPAAAIIQAEPYTRDPATWAYVPAFAERRMAAGLPISMIPHRPYAAASQNVQHGIFDASSAMDAHAWTLYLHVDYLLVGTPERLAYRPQVERMLARPDLFQQVFRNEAILLLKVLKPIDGVARRQ